MLNRSSGGKMTHIKYFEIVRDIIESNMRAFQGTFTRNELCAQLRNYSSQMSENWMSGQQPNIPYHDPLCRMAYLYSSVPVNANLVEHVFERDSELEEYLDETQQRNGRVSICAFGAGPGTELLGLGTF